MNLRDIVISQEEFTEENLAPEMTPEEANLEIVADDALEVTDEVIAESEEIEGYTEELGEATEEIEDIEAVESSLTEQLEDENYEGMDEVALEMLQRRLSRIQSKYGLNSKDLRDVVSKENFTGVTGKRRRVNTEIALESLTATLKKWWDSIKAAAIRAWDAIVAFVKRWFTEAGRLTAELKKLETQVKGLKDLTEKEVEAPSALKDAFGHLSTIDKSSVISAMSAQFETARESYKFVEKNVDLFKKLSESASKDSIKEVVKSAVDAGEFKFGTKESPLVTGFYATASFKASEDGDSVKLEFKKESIEKSKDAKKFKTGSKSDLLEVITKALILTEEAGKFSKNIDGANTRIKVSIKKLDEEIKGRKESTDDQKAGDKNVRNIGKFIVSVNSALSVVGSSILSLNMKAVKGCIAYVKTSVNGTDETPKEDKKEETKEDKKD